MTQRQYFGTDGIRGRVGDSHINAQFALTLGWACGRVLADLLDNPITVLIGRDTRSSCAMLESALQAGLSAAGVNSCLLGVIPTPGVAYLTHSLRTAAGIVISASHNPFHDNGIKFFDRKGTKLSDDIELAIEAQITKPMRTQGAGRLGQIEQLTDASGRYIEFCKSVFPGSLTLKGLKIVVDCANGATFKVAPAIFHELGAQVIAIHHKPDGFNINQACGATDVRDLQKQVTQHSADVGLAFDGDGDRLIMVDHKGEKVDGDETIAILAQHLLSAQQKMGVVGTVMSNLGLEQALDKLTIPFVRTKVGDRHVMETLRKHQWWLGGEPSGHIINLKHITTGDGIITALQILAIMQTTARSLNQLKTVMIKRPQVLLNVAVFGDKDLSRYPNITRTVEQMQQQLNGQGRILLRPSGTEPLIRVMVEGNDEAQVREMANTLAQCVEREVQS